MSNQSNPKGGHQPSRQDEAARKPGSRTSHDDTSDERNESGGTRHHDDERDSEGSRGESRKPGGSRREAAG